MHKPTITIGIPAYNEEANIEHLLSSIVRQDQDGFELLEIIVISDGSQDRTVAEARKLNNSLITVIDRKENLGCTGTQNEICDKARGDILVMLDADVILLGEDFMQKIIEPIVIGTGAHLVGANTVSMPGRTFFEKIIAHSHTIKQYLYKSLSEENNIYLCHGRARAFIRELYTQIRWPVPQHGEDAYSYLFCVSHGFKFVYQSRAKILFRSPSTWNDYVLQSKRFMNGQKLLEKEFPPELVQNSYRIPKKAFAKTIAVFLLRNPFYTISFIIIYTYIRYFVRSPYSSYTKWKVSKTSKKII